MDETKVQKQIIMKEEWKVFIKGVSNRGKEVIKALTDLGANNCVHYTGRNPHCLFYINHKGVVDWSPLDSETGQIIIDYYKEIKLPEKWNDGDILINNDETYYKIFSGYDTDNADLFYAQPLLISTDGKITDYNFDLWVCDIKNYRLATSYEVMCFYKLLHDNNKDWDSEKKQLVNLKWKPKEGDDYWTIILSGINFCLKFTWIGTKEDEGRYKLGNCFKTKKEAKVMAEKIKKLLNTESSEDKTTVV